MFLIVCTIQECEDIGGKCITILNGFYIGTGLCMILGFIWYGVCKKPLENLQTEPAGNWIVNVKQLVSGKVENSYTVTISNTTIS